MVLERLSGLLNRNIAASTRAQELCGKLEDRSFRVDVEGVPIKILMRVKDGNLQLSRVSDAEVLSGTQPQPDASIGGTPLGLLSLMRAASAERLRSGAVAIAGDAEIAQGFHELLRAARPELEEELSRLIGDVAAHRIGNLVRGVTGWGRKAAQTATSNVSEYLQEESRDLVTRTEMEEFLAEVDAIREAADRVDARMTLLTTKDTQ